MIARAALLALAALGFTPLHAKPVSAAFKSDERWTAIGDSITHDGSYWQAVQLFHLTRSPGRKLDVFNCGISGDTAEGAVRRYAWDVAPRHPTVASVMLGMNDVGRDFYSAEPPTPATLEQRRVALATHRQSQRALVTTLQKDGVRVILITPSIFDQTAELDSPKQTGVNDALGECAQFAKTLAAETGAALVDFHGPMTQLNAELQKNDPRFTLVGPDRVHLAGPGHFVMAYLFLKAQGAPADVSRLSLDAAKSRATHARNGRVENIGTKQGRLTFTWTENALPFPVEPGFAPALAWVPFTQEFNQEILQITHLAPGSYELRIDGNPIRTYAGNELSRGVNLAIETATPQYRQALAVSALVGQRTHAIAARQRTLALFEHSLPELQAHHPNTPEQAHAFFDKRLAALKTDPARIGEAERLEAYLDGKNHEAEAFAEAAFLAAEARRLAQPTPHVYELVPVTPPAG